MRESGGAAVVNIGSTAGMSAHPGVAYCASKWGLRGLTVSAALELLEWGIRVNAVHPVQIQGTGITTDASPGWRFAQERALPMQRGVTPQEVTQAVLFLASDAANYITGTDLPVDGGVLSTGIARVRTVLQQEFEKTFRKGDG
jgi:NAD(P)-dependent dehydrogenase (short-subunit alcohol dehydrogenase family)